MGRSLPLGRNRRPAVRFDYSAYSARSVAAVRSIPLSSHSRLYTTAQPQPQQKQKQPQPISDADLEDIKELTSPILYERRIKDLYQAAEKHIDEERWIQAEDRFWTILDTCEQLKSTLKDLGKNVSTNKYLIDEFLGRVHLRLAFSQHNQGKRDFAEEHYGKGIELLRSGLGPEHPEVAYALINLSEVLSLLSRLDEAEAKLREALPLIEKAHGQEHEIYAGALGNLGGLLCAKGNFAEALAPNERALELFDKVLGTDNEYTLSTVSNCLKMYEELDHKDKIAQLKARLDAKHQEFVEMHKKNENFSKEEVDKIAGDWDRELAKKVFDPAGMYKDKTFHREELKAFLNVWKSQGGQISEEEMAVVLKELDGMSDEDLDKAAHLAPEELLEHLKELRSAPPLPGDTLLENGALRGLVPDAEEDKKEQEAIAAYLKKARETTKKAAEGGAEQFAYDEDLPDKAKGPPTRGYWRRLVARNARRKKKTLEKSIDRDLDPNAGMTEQQLKEQEELFYRKAKATSSLTPEVLDMMDKEEALTENQLQRESDALFVGTSPSPPPSSSPSSHSKNVKK